MFIEHILPLLEPLKDSLVAEAGRNNDPGAVAPDQQRTTESVEVPMEHSTSTVNSLEAMTKDRENSNNSNDNDSAENSEWKSNINLCKTGDDLMLPSDTLFMCAWCASACVCVCVLHGSGST